MVVDFFTFSGLGLAVVGLGFAARQFRDARTQIDTLAATNDDVKESLERLETVVSGLDAVAHALPTRVLGEWPDYLVDLGKVIGRAERSLTVLCDHPAYGAFSNPEGHAAYRRAIEERLVAGVDVRMIFLAPVERVALDDEIIPAEEDWDESYRRRVATVCETWRHLVIDADDSLGRRDFLALLEAMNVSVTEGFESAALVGGNYRRRQVLSRKESSSLLPLYAWVRDSVEAVFAVAVLSGGHKEIAFVTIDPGLIGALEGVFDRYASQSNACSRDLSHPWP